MQVFEISGDVFMVNLFIYFRMRKKISLPCESACHDPWIGIGFIETFVCCILYSNDGKLHE